MHALTGSREPELGALPPPTFDDAEDRRAADRAVGWVRSVSPSPGWLS